MIDMSDSMNASDGNHVSFKDVLLGKDSIRKGVHEDDDMKLHDGDVIMTIIDGILFICLLKRVHSLIEKSMSLMVKIKLMGRRVGFNSLSSKVYTL